MKPAQVPHADVLNILKEVEIFRRVPPSVMDELAHEISLTLFEPGEKIINQGDIGNSMYVLLSGHVKVHDKEFTVAEIEKGNFFGEFSLLDDEPRSLSITAMAPTVTGSIQRLQFYHLLDKYPDVTRDIIKVILKRLRTQNRKIVDELKKRQKELEALVTERTTDLRRKNEDLEITLDALRKTQAQLVLKEENEKQFLANMSHEIRTPLNAINGMTRLMLMRDQSPDNLAHLEMIRRSCDNLIVIVNDILDLSKIQSGKMKFERIPFKPAESLQLTYDTVRFKAEEKGLSLVTRLDPNVPEVLAGDPTRLNQILINLAGNAVKFTEKGTVTIHCFNDAAHQGNGSIHNLRFSIIDTGIGMTPEQLNKVFESFSQASTEITRKYGGTGLGLTISKQLIELQGGTLTVESTYGTGTTFTFFIPYHHAEEQVADTSIQKTVSEVREKVSKLKVIMAEDNEFNQMVAVGLLREIAPGIEIECVTNGKELLHKLAEKPYDIILMDVQMPEMDGIEATMEIRRRKNPIPIIAMTAGITSDEIARCKQAGTDEFVPKPFDPEELITKMARLTRRSK
jgi:signal transduction histidine kinase/ActR/RegA family two-component response regulator